MLKSRQNIFRRFQKHSEVFGKSSEITGTFSEMLVMTTKNLLHLNRKKLAGIVLPKLHGSYTALCCYMQKCCLFREKELRF